MRGRVLAAVAVAALLAGCSSGVQVDTYPTEDGTELSCRSLLADAGHPVAGQESRLVKDGVAAAWGDPPIVLRCGVERPEALRQTSRCDVVDGVGWFTEDVAGGLLFTTIGRRFYVSVEVPEEYQPAADALVDLAGLVKRHDPVVRDCV